MDIIQFMNSNIFMDIYGPSHKLIFLQIIRPHYQGVINPTAIYIQQFIMDQLSHRTHIKTWIDTIKYNTSQITPNDVANHLSLILDEHTQSSNLNKSDDIELLWKNNQYFYQSMLDIAQDILHYVYAPIQSTRNTVPKCLVGYYQIIKNLQYLSVNDQRQCRKLEKPIKQQKKHDWMPRAVNQFLQFKIYGILFGSITASQLDHEFVKFSDSPLVKLFKSELLGLIQYRVAKFEDIYGIKFLNIAKKILGLCIFDGQPKNDEIANATIDQLLVCIVYLGFKANKQPVIFNKIIRIYENSFNATINRLKILAYFNDVFLNHFYPKVQDDLRSMTTKKNSSHNEKFTGSQIKEDKSFFDMFDEE